MPVTSLPLPAAVKTRLVKVTETALGLFALICSTGKPVTPGGWVLLTGELGPTATEIAGGFGVLVIVGVIVWVAVGGRVPVGLMVIVGVWVGVEVGTAVRVHVAVAV
jgi:hypothetical protein